MARAALLLAGAIFAAAQTCNRPIDMVFVLDSSGSVSTANFQTVKQ